MTFNQIGLLSIIALCAIGCSSNIPQRARANPVQERIEPSSTAAPSPSTHSKPPLDVNSPEFKVIRSDRMTKLDAFVKAANNIAIMTKDQEALEIMNFLQANGRAAVAAGEQNIISDTTPAKHAFFLAVVTAEDAEFGQPWRDSWERRETIIAHYERGAKRNILVLPDVQVSDFVRGLVMLHELRHAKSHNTSIVPDTVAGTLDEEEPAYRLQERLALKLGGPICEKMIETEASQLATQLKGRTPDTVIEGLTLAQYRYKREDMPTAFPGLCKPDDERFCYSLFNRMAVNRAIHKVMNPADAKTAQRKALEATIRMAGILPKEAK